MKLIRLTEYVKDENQGEMKKRPVLINPEGIGTVSESTMQQTDMPLIGINSEDISMRLITLRNNQKLAVEETLDQIEKLINDAGN